MGLTPLPEALAVVLADIGPPPDSEVISLHSALGRVLARDVVSALDVPAADNSAMDGYAVRAADLPGELPVSRRITAGTDPGSLPAGTAARIFTGALLPTGADTVVMQEDAVARGDIVSILGCVTAGGNVRRRGADVRSGDRLLQTGQRLTPQALGVVASAGYHEVTVYRRLRVALLSTGDELVSPGPEQSPIHPWQIYNSNRVQLCAQISGLGYDVLDLGTVEDDPAAIGAALEHAASEADLIVTTGGVSVGEADFVREQIERRGALALWKLAIKPGKPLAYGRVNDTPVFGLPGNPVSAWATFLLVVKPWLGKAQGAHAVPVRRIMARTDFAVSRAGTREEYLRVTLEGQGSKLIASLAGSQSSGVLSSVSLADGLAVIPIGTTLAAGDPVEVMLMESLQSPYTA